MNIKNGSEQQKLPLDVHNHFQENNEFKNDFSNQHQKLQDEILRLQREQQLLLQKQQKHVPGRTY